MKITRYAAGVAAFAMLYTGGAVVAQAADAAPVAAPVTSSISPSHGPAAGGQAVTITGAFAPSTDAGLVVTVHFGAVLATSVVDHVGGATVTAVSPAHLPGHVEVTVTQAGDTTNPADHGTSAGISYRYDTAAVHHHSVAGEIRSRSYPGSAVDDWHSGTGNLNKVDVYPVNHTGAQDWTVSAGVFTPAGGTISLSLLGGCLDVFHGSSPARPVGTLVDRYSCNGTPAQVWVWHAATGELVNPLSGLVLDAPGSVAGTQLVLGAVGAAGGSWSLP